MGCNIVFQVWQGFINCFKILFLQGFLIYPSYNKERVLIKELKNNFLFAALCVCVGEIISLPWFSKELKNNL
jgi:hypothetical protein